MEALKGFENIQKKNPDSFIKGKDVDNQKKRKMSRKHSLLLTQTTKESPFFNCRTPFCQLMRCSYISTCSV